MEFTGEGFAQRRSVSETQMPQQADELLKARSDTLAQINLQAVELSETRARVSQLSAELDAARTKLLLYDEQLIQKADELARARTAYEAQLRQQEEMLACARAQLAMYETQLEQQAASLTEAESKLLKKEKVLQWIQTSRSWQVISSLKRVQQGLYHFRQFNHKVQRKLHLPGQRDFQGAIDSPDKASRINRYLDVSGWVFSNAAPVVRVEAFLDKLSLGEVQYGQARPDVVAAYQSQASVDCGYAGRFPVDEFLTGRRTLMIRAWDALGNSKNFVRKIFVDVPDNQSVIENSRPAIPEKAVGASEKIDSPVPQEHLSASKKFLTSMAKISLESFLNSNATIEIPRHEKPETSIILVLYNRAELTLQCLYSILKSTARSFEIIIVDNASTDETRLLLKRIKGARIIENETNVYYLLGCNQAVRQARGEFLLLLNNDTQILADSISSALETIKSSPDIGAVGGKIILPDGTLQEAGCIIWQDGSCLGYGRGDSPSAPAYMFKRDVDYCSAAFLFTRRDLFLEDGGFDEDYVPAYYEETDYCVRLWKKGKRVVYDPNVIVLHHEFASSVSVQSAINMAIMNQPTFVSKNQDWLRLQQLPAQENILAARISERRGGQRILFIDDNVPHESLGADFHESNRLLSELAGTGHVVTLYPLNLPQEGWASIYRDIPLEVEVIVDRGLPRLEEFLNERSGYYDLIFISSSDQVAALKSLLEKPQPDQKLKVVCGAQELSSFLNIKQLRSKESVPIERSKARSFVSRSA